MSRRQSEETTCYKILVRHVSKFPMNYRCPQGRIAPLSFSLLASGENVEFDRQLIFNLDGSTCDANGSNIEIALPQRKLASISSILHVREDLRQALSLRVTRGVRQP